MNDASILHFVQLISAIIPSFCPETCKAKIKALQTTWSCPSLVTVRLFCFVFFSLWRCV